MINITEDMFGMIFILILAGVPFIFCMWAGHVYFKKEEADLNAFCTMLDENRSERDD